ncbi:MAG: hypothetical protein AAGI37_15995 [Planctomycetota bacterium]
MQHRYVPDLGDFSKFAVIDALSGKGEDRTALIWYLVNPYEVSEAHKNDGKHTAYLVDDRQRIAECHPGLYQRFQAIYRTGEKHVGVYARHRVLPNINYFPEPLSYDGQVLSQREACRARWLELALQAASEADLVVLDPDNGLMANRLSVRSQSAVKYATLDECKAFYASGQRTLVVYQHAHRQGPVADQAELALHRLADHLGLRPEAVFALRFHRGTARCYLVVPATGKASIIRSRASVMLEGRWGVCGHFSLIE